MKYMLVNIENIFQRTKVKQTLDVNDLPQEELEDMIIHHRKLLALFEQQRMKYKNKQRLTS
jgi:hypothetical protein